MPVSLILGFSLGTEPPYSRSFLARGSVFLRIGQRTMLLDRLAVVCYLLRNERYHRKTDQNASASCLLLREGGSSPLASNRGTGGLCLKAEARPGPHQGVVGA